MYYFIASQMLVAAPPRASILATYVQRVAHWPCRRERGRNPTVGTIHDAQAWVITPTYESHRERKTHRRCDTLVFLQLWLASCVAHIAPCVVQVWQKKVPSVPVTQSAAGDYNDCKAKEHLAGAQRRVWVTRVEREALRNRADVVRQVGHKNNGLLGLRVNASTPAQSMVGVSRAPWSCRSRPAFLMFRFPVVRTPHHHSCR